MLLQDGPGAWIGERWRPDVEVVPRLPLVDVEPSERRCLVWHFYDAACDAHVRQPGAALLRCCCCKLLCLTANAWLLPAPARDWATSSPRLIRSSSTKGSTA